MYLAITRTPHPVQSTEGKAVSMHLLFVHYLNDSQEIAPVFLSKLHAYLYLKPAGLLDEFQLVPLDSMLLDVYRHSVHDATFPVECRIGIGVIKQEGAFQLAMYDKRFSMRDLFFSQSAITQELIDALGGSYHTICETNQLPDPEIIQMAEKHALENNINLTQNTSKEDPKQIEAIIDRNLDKEIGSLYGFVLTFKNGSIFLTPEQDKPVINVFVNKLDAVVFSHMWFDKINEQLDVVSFNPNNNPHYFNFIRRQYQAGKAQFRIAYGFLGTFSPIGVKWAKKDARSDVPAILAENCSLAEVENGIDLRFYLIHVPEEDEREIALTGLLKTNLTPIEKLKSIAQKYYADMKANLVTIENDSFSFHRIISVGM